MKLTAKQKELLHLFLSEAKIPMTGTVEQLHKATSDLVDLKSDVFNAEIIEDEEDDNGTEGGNQDL